MRSWPGTQSLLSMWFHDELVPAVERYGLTDLFVAGGRAASPLGGGPTARPGTWRRTWPRWASRATRSVLIGDSVDDADAAHAVGARCVLYTGGFTDPSGCARPACRSPTR